MDPLNGIISFITETDVIEKILTAIHEDSEPPVIASARAPPLWELADSDQTLEYDECADSIPEDHFDQTESW